MRMIIACIISFIVGAILMLLVLTMAKSRKPQNNVHFYVAKEMNGDLYLYLGKPSRGLYVWEAKQNCKVVASDNCFQKFNLYSEDFKNMGWKDEPVEVFLNSED